MSMSQRDRRAIKLGVAGAAVLGLYFGVVEPLEGRYDRLVERHQTSAEKIARNIEEKQRLAAKEAEVKTWEEKAGTLVVEKTYSEQMTAVGSRIMTAAGENQVQIQGVIPTAATPWVDAPGSAGAGPKLEQASFNIDAQGPWENVFKFLAAVYRIEGVLSVEQLDLNSDAKGGPLKVRLVVSVLMRASAEGRR